jgi:hypothetical protein
MQIRKRKPKVDVRGYKVQIRNLYTEIEFAVLLNEDLDRILTLAKRNKLPWSIRYRQIYGKYVFQITDSTARLIESLKEKGVTRIIDLLLDCVDSRFMLTLKINVHDIDLSSYKD